MKKLLSILLFLTSFVYAQANEQSEKPLVYKINIKEDIGSHSFIHLKNGMYHATQQKAKYILIEMNTYGGTVLEADSMRTAILNSEIPVYVFINNNAASAGALISIACDKIYMRSSANMGAATVVNETGEKAPDKYQSYMRSIMRSTAESHGHDTIVQQNGDTVYKWKRDPKIAEAMVDESLVIEGVIDSTKVLTLTAYEAQKLGYCDGIVENTTSIITQHMGLTDYEIDTYNPTTFDRIKRFLTNGVVQSILITLIIGGIFFEMKAPGLGLPSAIAIVSALLYFTPLYMDGYAQNWEILVFVVGLIFIAFEIFVIPGFGFAGISGIILTIAGLFLSMVSNVNFDFDAVPTAEITASLVTVLAGFILSVALIAYFANKIGKEGMFKNIALHTDQEGFSSVPDKPKHLIGKEGVAATMLRPSGKVIIDGEYYDAVAYQAYIEKDSPVRVVKYENSQVYVTIVR